MENLSPEIWIMIFEEIYEVEPYDPYSFVPPLQRLRLVSSWFNVVVTPYLYRQRYLRARHLAETDEPRSARELSNIRAFTKELVMADYHEMNDSLLGPAADQISACGVLECLKWHTTSPASARRTGLVPTLILGAFLTKSIRNARVEISQNWFTISPHVEPKSLGFIQRSKESSSLHQQSAPQSPATLDLLEIETRSYFPILSPIATRLPPMKALILRSYNWFYADSQVSMLWDFSLLQYLRLDDVPLFRFFTSIPASQFHNLRCLDLKPHFYIYGGNESNKPPLAQLFRTTTLLEELDIAGCWRELITIGSLSHLPNLRVLRIKKLHTGRPDEEGASYGMKVNEIKEIQASCRKLIGVEFDVEFAGHEPLQSLSLFSTFPSLQRLHINAAHRLSPLQHPPPNSQSPMPIPITVFNPDPLNIAQMLTHLQTSKLGNPFTRIDISLSIRRESPGLTDIIVLDANPLIPISETTFPSESDSESEREEKEPGEGLQRWFRFLDCKGEQVLWRGDEELR